MARAGDYSEVQVTGLGTSGGAPHVVLGDGQGRRLPIAIGPCEMEAIGQRLDETFDAPRPLAQDLALAGIRALGAELIMLRIDDFWEGPREHGTFYGQLILRQGDAEVMVDCRPSDGIALALAAGVMIVVADSILTELGFNPDADEE